MNPFNTFIVFALSPKTNPFTGYVKYDLLDRSFTFFDNVSAVDLLLVVTPGTPYTMDERTRSNFTAPMLLYREYEKNLTLNHGMPVGVDVFNNTYVLSVFTFSRSHTAIAASNTVSATFVNGKGFIDYTRQNVPRFAYEDATVNLLSGSSFVPGNNGFTYLPAQSLGTLHGWLAYCNALRTVVTTDDVPNALVPSSQYFLLSTCLGCANLGDPTISVRNSILGTIRQTGIPADPVVTTATNAIFMQSLTGGWQRVSLTVPSSYWAHRIAARVSPTDKNPPFGVDNWLRLTSLWNTFIANTTFAVWGAQLEAGHVATAYETTNASLVSGAIPGKNLIPNLSCIYMPGSTFNRWITAGDTVIRSLTSMTPFGDNPDNPSLLISSGGKATNLLELRYRQRPTTAVYAPGNNQLRNTDFSGAVPGIVDNTSLNSPLSSGILPYWQRLGFPTNTVTTIVSTGQINGFNFVDYNFTRIGTGTAVNITLDPEFVNYVYASGGQTWTFTISAALINGSMPGGNALFMRIMPLQTAPTEFVQVAGATHLNPNTKALTNAVSALTVTAILPAVSAQTRVYPQLLIPAGNLGGTGAFNFTIRLLGPQLELGSISTPYIPTPTVTHVLSTYTFSCYVKPISGTIVPWFYPAATGEGTVGGFLQQIAVADPTRIRRGQQVTVSMYAKFGGVDIPSNAKLEALMGISDSSYKNILLTPQWQRFTYTGLFANVWGFRFSVNRLQGVNATYDPNTTRVYFAGMQCEYGPKVTDYVDTTTRSIGSSAVPYGILMEPARANYALHSTDLANIAYLSSNNVMLTSFNIRAPDNVSIAQALSGNKSNGFLSLTGFSGGTSGSRYVVSFFIKSDTYSTILISQDPQHNGSRVRFEFDTQAARVFNPSQTNASDSYGIQEYPFNWYRIYYTTLCNANNGKIWPSIGFAQSSPNGGSVNIWGAQIEEGSYPTSYIPVSGFIVSRSQDILTLSGDNFTTIYNRTIPATTVSPNTGTIFVRSFRKDVSDQQQVVLQGVDNSSRNFSFISHGTLSNQVSSQVYTTSLNTIMPISWKSNFINSAFSYNNGTKQINLAAQSRSISGAIVSDLNLARLNFGVNGFNGYINKIIMFPEALSLSDIATITS